MANVYHHYRGFTDCLNKTSEDIQYNNCIKHCIAVAQLRGYDWKVIINRCNIPTCTYESCNEYNYYVLSTDCEKFKNMTDVQQF